MLIKTKTAEISVYRDSLDKSICMMVDRGSEPVDTVFLPNNKKSLKACLAFCEVLKEESKEIDLFKAMGMPEVKFPEIKRG